MDPLAQLAQLRAQQQPQPIGPNQGIGGLTPGAPAPTGGAPIGAPSHGGPSLPVQTNGSAQDTLNEFAHAAVGRNDPTALAAHLRALQRMYPKLLLADHNNGHAEMVGPAQEQFLAAAYARSKGAKVAHVRNTGRGQRLHLEF